MIILPTQTCFDDALDFMERRFKEDRSVLDRLILVHGICLAPEGPRKGEPFAHAWVEDGDEVWQDGLLQTGERVSYSLTIVDFRELLRPQKETHYTTREALAENMRTGHFGPWEEEYRALCGKGETFWPKCEGAL